MFTTEYLQAARMVDLAMYAEILGMMIHDVYQPRRIDRFIAPLPRLVEDAWIPADKTPAIEDIVGEITAELRSAAYMPNLLGGYYCMIPARKKAAWTKHPELVAQEMNRSMIFSFHVLPADVVRAQKRLGVWDKRKNREAWEFAIAS